MVANMRERGLTAFSQISENQLPEVVRWLELLAATRDNPDVEAEELWLLATGELKKMDDEIGEALPIEDWRKYLNEL